MPYQVSTGFAVVTLPQTGFAQTNPRIGNWKLSLAKSTYNAGALAPRTSTFNFQIEGQDLKNTVEGIDAEGKPTKAVFVHIYDGKPYPTTAQPVTTQAPTRQLMATS
jgi:hypothetical protein